MPHFAKPAEGSWTEHYPELGTGPVSYEDSISPEHYELERDAIFRRTWLNVGRVEQLPRAGQLLHQGARRRRAPRSSSCADTDGEVRAFHNICRHRGNKLVWNDYPQRGDERHLPPVHLQVPRLALRPRRATSPSSSRSRSSSTSTRPTTAWRRCGRGVGGLHLREPRSRRHRRRCATTSASSARGSRATRSTR